MLTNRELILLKIESSYGVDALPDAANDALLVESPGWSNEGLRMNERMPIRKNIGSLQHIYGGALKTVTFDVELKGSGAAGTAPELDPVLRACGMGSTVVASTSVSYNPVSEGHESATLYYYEDEMLHKLTGCRGNVSFAGEVGTVPKLSVTMTGHVANPEDASIPDPTLSNVVPSPAISTPFTVGGFAAVINSFSFDLGNAIATAPDMAASDGFGEVRISKRDVNGSFDPENVTVAENDFLGDFKSGASMALQWGAFGSTPGNIVTVNMPAIYYRDVSQGDREGIRTREIPFGAVDDTGDDDVSIVFT